MLLAAPLVATFFQHGRFTAFDTRMTALSVLGLSFGLPAFALVKVVLPAFYSRQDTSTPVRAGVSALVANMLLNFAILALLYTLWVPDALKREGVWQGLASTPGLHLALGIASALSSYLNLWLLWHWLRRDGVYQAQPGWSRFIVRLLVACAVMCAVVLAGLWLAPDFTSAPVMARALWLALLVGAGAGSYAGVLFALGWRLRELREH
jgi:putative peptidoglycan lipid II flippase